MDRHYPRLVGLTFMGEYYGLRRSGILGLKWSAVNWDKGTISISHTVVRVKSVMAEDATKTQAGRRELNLFDTARSCLLKIGTFSEKNMPIVTDMCLYERTGVHVILITYHDSSQRQWQISGDRRLPCISCDIPAVHF